jgi:hypothetical protein
MMTKSAIVPTTPPTTLRMFSVRGSPVAGLTKKPFTSAT